MRVIASIGAAALLIGLAAAPAVADGTSAPERRSHSVKARVTAKHAAAQRPLSYRRDSSPYFSYGYPRLYYYPWGLPPRRRWI